MLEHGWALCKTLQLFLILKEHNEGDASVSFHIHTHKFGDDISVRYNV